MNSLVHRFWKKRALAAIGVTAVAVSLTIPAATAATGPTPAGGAGSTSSSGVPKNFKARSMDWLNAKQAMVIGTGKCSPRPCSDFVTTTDGAKTWSLVGSLPVPIEKLGKGKAVGVNEVRFSTTSVGWAFDPLLVKTTDGGQTWTQETIPGGGHQVLSLAADVHGAWAVVSACKYGHGICKQPLTFWHTSLNGSWKQIPLDLAASIDTDVAVHGKTVYVEVGTLFTGGDQDQVFASTDGRHFSTRPSPCDHTQDLELTQIVPTTATDVNLLCVGDPGMSKAVKTVYRSDDTAKTTTYAGQAGFEGIQSQLAASRSGNLAMSSQSDGSFVYVNDGGGTSWSMPVGLGDGGLGWNDIVYTTNKTAWVIHAPAGGFEPQGVLYVTHDAGQSWQPQPF
jgi:photosystem II stability/assembly factor-like uncharacterized protein